MVHELLIEEQPQEFDFGSDEDGVLTLYWARCACGQWTLVGGGRVVLEPHATVGEAVRVDAGVRAYGRLEALFEGFCNWLTT